MNFSKNKPTEQNHLRHAFTSSHPHQVTKKIQKKDHTSSCTIHQVVIQILWKKKIPPCYYAIPHSTSPIKKKFTQEQISRTGSLNQLNFTFLSRPSFAHHISHSLSTFTLPFLFSCWYMQTKHAQNVKQTKQIIRTETQKLQKQIPRAQNHFRNSETFSKLKIACI
uniref:Uncharacterized protein n=1 Tax=Populus davidiana TaxID=266767 RepID=A0A6M2E9N3_9ROSI